MRPIVIQVSVEQDSDGEWEVVISKHRGVATLQRLSIAVGDYNAAMRMCMAIETVIQPPQSTLDLGE